MEESAGTDNRKCKVSDDFDPEKTSNSAEGIGIKRNKVSEAHPTEGADISSSLAPAPSVGTPQIVHTPLFQSASTALPGHNDVTELPVHSGRTQAYRDWWQQEQGNSCLFGAQLIGDALQLSNISSMAFTDLAFCR